MSEDLKDRLQETIEDIKSSEYEYQIQLWELIENHINKNYSNLKEDIGNNFRFNLLKLHIYREINARIFYSEGYFFSEEEDYYMSKWKTLSLIPVPFIFEKSMKLNEKKINEIINRIILSLVILLNNPDLIKNKIDLLETKRDLFLKKIKEESSERPSKYFELFFIAWIKYQRKSKSPIHYTYQTALLDANKVIKSLPDDELNYKLIEINNNFKTWRNKYQKFLHRYKTDFEILIKKYTPFKISSSK